MAEKWKLQDSARTMTQKYNSLVEEVNETSVNKISTEGTKVIIKNDLTEQEIDNILAKNGR